MKRIKTIALVAPSGNIRNIDAVNNNIATLKSIPGIGPKMAQKIIFELKDKVIKDQMIDISEKKLIKNTINPNESEAITALQVLGYSQNQIKEVILNLDIANNSVEEIIRKVLKEMQKI